METNHANEYSCDNQSPPLCGLGYGPQPTYVNCADVVILPQGQTISFVLPDYQSLYASVDANVPVATTTTDILSTQKIEDTTTMPSTTASTIPVVTVPVVTGNTSPTGTTEAPPSETPPKLIFGTTTTPSSNQQQGTTSGTGVQIVPGGIFQNIISGGTSAGSGGNNWNLSPLIPLLLLGALFPLLFTRRPTPLSSLILLNESQERGPFIPFAGYGLPYVIPDSNPEPPSPTLNRNYGYEHFNKNQNIVKKQGYASYRK